MSTFYLPPAAAAIAATQIDHPIATVDPGSSVEEEGELTESLPAADPGWFAAGIEKHNAALFQAACIGYRPQLSEAVRTALGQIDRSFTETEFSLIVDCLVDVAFEAAKQEQQPWHAFSNEDRIKWLSQFADQAIAYYDSL